MIAEYSVWAPNNSILSPIYQSFVSEQKCIYENWWTPRTPSTSECLCIMCFWFRVQFSTEWGYIVNPRLCAAFYSVKHVRRRRTPLPTAIRPLMKYMEIWNLDLAEAVCIGRGCAKRHLTMDNRPLWQRWHILEKHLWLSDDSSFPQ